MTLSGSSQGIAISGNEIISAIQTRHFRRPAFRSRCRGMSFMGAAAGAVLYGEAELGRCERKDGSG
jgi:hypothetical protein